MNDNEVFVCSERSAVNLIFQNAGPRGEGAEDGSPICIRRVKGQELIGEQFSFWKTSLVSSVVCIVFHSFRV
jgi:hypothetical protein